MSDVAHLYRLYLVDAGGHVEAPPIVLRSLDDVSAMLEGTVTAAGRRAELWDRERKVADLPSELITAG